MQDAIALLRLEDLYVESFEIKDVKVGLQLAVDEEDCENFMAVAPCGWWHFCHRPRHSQRELGSNAPKYVPPMPTPL